MNDLVTLGERLKRRDISNSDFVNAESLISIKDGVRIFNISSDGGVCSPSDTLPVHIIRLKDEPQIRSSAGKEESSAFLHVADWLYPLVPGVTPVLYSSYGAYIFPDLMASNQAKSSQSFVALMFPEALPSKVRQLFQDILRSLTVLLEQVQGYVSSSVNSQAEAKSGETSKPKQLKELSLAADKLSQGLFDAVEWIADEVEKGADTVKDRVTEESKKLQQKQKHTVDPNIQEGIIYAKEVADTAVKVSGCVVNKLGEITTALGKDLAAQAKRDMKAARTSNVDQAGSSEGCVPIYAALDEAARTLERCLAGGTEHVTRYKYGENPV